MSALPPVLFVGGAPRSGTTVLHALLCTSSRTCVYHPEVTFIRPLVESYLHGLTTWSSHTNAFFAHKEHFHHHLQRIVGWGFDHVAQVLKEPEVLCVKDPRMTPLFGPLRELLGPRIRFVTIVRHPYDILRSRQTVIERYGQFLTPEIVQTLAEECADIYRRLDDPRLNGASVVIRYEDLAAPETIETLRQFTGLDDLAPEAVWAESRDHRADSDDGAWGSPKYHAPIDLTPRHPPLAPEWREIAHPLCAEMMTRFGYAHY